MVRLTLLLGAWLTTSACSEASPAAPDAGDAGGSGVAGGSGAPAEVTPIVELGVPSGPDGLDFTPLEDGTELRLQTFGQGGTHLLVGIRCAGFGKRAFISGTLENLTTGVQVEEPAPARPQLLFCGDDGFCDLVPYLMHASGLTETDEEKDGLHVLLSAQARNEAGAEAKGSREVVLSTADL